MKDFEVSPEVSRGDRLGSALTRGAGLFGFWLLLSAPLSGESLRSLAPDLAVGALAAAWATWVSLRLLPPAGGRIRFLALGRLAGSFLWQSVVGGLDVALRAFHPRMPLRPGFLAYRVGLPPGPGRAAFGALTSLMPGTVPVGTDASDALVYHCLDLDQPVAAGLAREEALLSRVRGPGARGADSA
ncbi:MAG: Na+/H+ antiporter subunit E [Chromatiaceae bacterium]|jgi:multicomponent Na+:H+ antiporter subunit E